MEIVVRMILKVKYGQTERAESNISYVRSLSHRATRGDEDAAEVEMIMRTEP